jgi:hypothetical protein
MQLEVDPLFEAETADFFDIARTRAESQTVERLEDLAVGGKFGFEGGAGVNEAGTDEGQEDE